MSKDIELRRTFHNKLAMINKVLENQQQAQDARRQQALSKQAKLEKLSQELKGLSPDEIRSIIQNQATKSQREVIEAFQETF